MALAVCVLASGCNCGTRLSHVGSELAVNPSMIDFGELPAGSVNDRLFTVENRGKASLTLSPFELVDDLRGAFEVAGTPGVLGPGEARTFRLIYRAPAAAGDDNATLVVSTGDAASAVDVPIFAGSLTCGDCGRDPSPDSGAPDSGTPKPPDAGTPDAGVPDSGTPDAGPPPPPPPPPVCGTPNTSLWTYQEMPACGLDAINISQGGIFTADTCAGSDHFSSACTPNGTKETLFYVPLTGNPAGGASYGPICLTPGFVWFRGAASTGTCSWVGPPPDSGYPMGCSQNCDPVTGVCQPWDNIGFSQSNHFWVAVERLDGGCGPFTMTWTRVH